MSTPSLFVLYHSVFIAAKNFTGGQWPSIFSAPFRSVYSGNNPGAPY